jgi:hypothetical protein
VRAGTSAGTIQRGTAAPLSLLALDSGWAERAEDFWAVGPHTALTPVDPRSPRPEGFVARPEARAPPDQVLQAEEWGVLSPPTGGVRFADSSLPTAEEVRAEAPHGDQRLLSPFPPFPPLPPPPPPPPPPSPPPPSSPPLPLSRGRTKSSSAPVRSPPPPSPPPPLPPLPPTSSPVTREARTALPVVEVATPSLDTLETFDGNSPSRMRTATNATRDSTSLVSRSRRLTPPLHCASSPADACAVAPCLLLVGRSKLASVVRGESPRECGDRCHRRHRSWWRLCRCPIIVFRIG